MPRDAEGPGAGGDPTPSSSPSSRTKDTDPNSAGVPPPRLALGLFSWCQHPNLARGARLETPRPLRQPPPAHELDGFLGLSLTREMSPRA